MHARILASHSSPGSQLYNQTDAKWTVEELGAIDHVWVWNGREIHEHVWLFSANSSDDGRLNRGETPDLVEAMVSKSKPFGTQSKRTQQLFRRSAHPQCWRS
jgi:hypothetical protein